MTGADNHQRESFVTRLFTRTCMTALKIFETPSNRTQTHSGRQVPSPLPPIFTALNDPKPPGSPRGELIWRLIIDVFMKIKREIKKSETGRPQNSFRET